MNDLINVYADARNPEVCLVEQRDGTLAPHRRVIAARCSKNVHKLAQGNHYLSNPADSPKGDLLATIDSKGVIDGVLVEVGTDAD